MKAKPMVSTYILRELFYYKDGNLYWKYTQNPKTLANQIAGHITKKGYRLIRIGRYTYMSGRVVYAYFNWKISRDLQIDHINRDKLDNRIENLRLVTPSDNLRNKDSSDRENLGVYWEPSRNKYRAVYHDNGKKKHIGRFSTEEEAIKARAEFLKGR
jgi:hypothetical protein